MPNHTHAELDRLAAEHVMHWPMVRLADEDKRFDAPIRFVEHAYSGEFLRVEGSKTDYRIARWSPTTTWAAAGEVVERMRALGFHYEIWSNGAPTGHEVDARFFKYREGEVVESGDSIDDSALLAITKAALLAVGAIEEKG